MEGVPFGELQRLRIVVGLMEEGFTFESAQRLAHGIAEDCLCLVNFSQGSSFPNTKVESRLRVVFHPKGWTFLRPCDTKTHGYWSSRDEAVSIARDYAQSEEIELVIHDEFGGIWEQTGLLRNY